jgi:AbrB family looped-hinge helix DNA binding protein
VRAETTAFTSAALGGCSPRLRRRAFMRTRVSSKGQIVLPAELRQRDRIESGQEFDVERVDRGEYRLIRRAASPNEGVVDCTRPRTDHCDAQPLGFRARRRDGRRSLARGQVAPAGD